MHPEQRTRSVCHAHKFHTLSSHLLALTFWSASACAQADAIMVIAKARIAEHPNRGKILVANQALHAGLTILQDLPIIIAPEDPLQWPHAFLEAPPSARARILDLYSPVDGPNAARVRAALLHRRGGPQAADAGPRRRAEDTMDTELSVKITMVFHFNGMGKHVCAKSCA